MYIERSLDYAIGRDLRKEEHLVTLELTEVFRPWVLVALGFSLMPFVIVVARRLLRLRTGA
jgi:hypothetical protein